MMWFLSKSFLMFLISIFSFSILFFLNDNLIMQFSLNSFIEIPLQITLIIDNQSMIFISTVSTVSSIILIYSFFYLKENSKYLMKKFSLILILFISSMFIISLSANLFWMMIGWDGLGISSFCLIIFYQNWKSFNSGMVTFMSNRLGDTLIILSIFMVMMNKSSNSWIMTDNSIIFLIIFSLGTFSKSAQLPYSFWLPQAMAAPTPVSALVHSSTLVTAGIYTMCRFNETLSNPYTVTVLFSISCLTMLVAGTSSLMEFDLKKIIALSTLCHISLMMMFAIMKDIKSCLFHLSMHAFFKSLLFMVAGLMIHFSMNSQDIRYMSFSMKDLKVSFPFFSSTLSMMGFPFLSGFYSKENLLVQSLFIFPSSIMMSMFLINSMFSCAYSIRISKNVFSNPKTPFISFSKDGFTSILLTSSFLSSFAGGILMPSFISSDMEMVNHPITKILLIVFSIIGVKMGMMNTQKLSIKTTNLLSTMWKWNFLYKMFQKHFFLLSSSIMWNMDEKGIAKSSYMNMLNKFYLSFHSSTYMLFKKPLSVTKYFHLLIMSMMMLL